ncbi:MFS transporter [Paenibacillus thailandensis]|uniref:MFS transporter n=1 Tax=Paenibacillus thailandensis TaxID=393250 RepID=A0ABW5QVZ8_9BACL
MSLPVPLMLKKAAVPPEKRLGRDVKLLLAMHALYQLGSSMAGVFLNLYLWRLTQSVWVNGMYTLLSVTAGVAGFALSGWLGKRKHSLLPYRLGVFLSALFYLIVIALQENVVVYYPIVALVAGLIGGTYWVGFLVLSYDVTTEHNRLGFFGINTVTFTFAGLVGPALAGWMISRSEGLAGYMITFAVAFFTFAASVCVTLAMKGKAASHKGYFLMSVPRLLRTKPEWTRSLYGFLVLGLFQGVMLFLPNILLYQATGREDSVGYLTILLSVTGMLSGMIQARIGRPELNKAYAFMAAGGLLLGSMLLVMDVNLVTVLIFLVLNSFVAPWQSNSLSTYHYKTIAQLPLRGQLRVESMVVRELFLSIGRAVSILLLIGSADNLSGYVLGVVMIGLALTQFVLPYCFGRE